MQCMTKLCNLQMTFCLYICILKAWLKAVRRDDWDSPASIIAGKATKGPSRSAVVCHAHFTEEDYIQWTYDGTLNISAGHTNMFIHTCKKQATI